jgi:hypothetical protein
LCRVGASRYSTDNYYRVEPSHLELLQFPVNIISSDVDLMDIVATAAHETGIANTSDLHVTSDDTTSGQRNQFKTIDPDQILNLLPQAVVEHQSHNGVCVSDQVGITSVCSLGDDRYSSSSSEGHVFEARGEISSLQIERSLNLTQPRDDSIHNETSAVLASSLIDNAARSYNIGRRKKANKPVTSYSLCGSTSQRALPLEISVFSKQ